MTRQTTAAAIDPTRDPPVHPRRRRFALPTVSGKWSVGALVLCMTTAGLAIPFSAHLAPWLEAELVVFAWWLIWCGVLTGFLHAGRHLDDDHKFGGLVSWFKKPKLDNLGDLGDLGGVDADGCVALLAVLVAGVALFLSVWLLWELVIPFVGMVLYILLRAMLVRVVHDTHGCEGSLGKSLLWGVWWATIYTGPFAAMIYGLHALRVMR